VQRHEFLSQLVARLKVDHRRGVLMALANLHGLREIGTQDRMTLLDQLIHQLRQIDTFASDACTSRTNAARACTDPGEDGVWLQPATSGRPDRVPTWKKNWCTIAARKARRRDSHPFGCQGSSGERTWPHCMTSFVSSVCVRRIGICWTGRRDRWPPGTPPQHLAATVRHVGCTSHSRVHPGRPEAPSR